MNTLHCMKICKVLFSYVISDGFFSLFGLGGERPNSVDLVLEKEEFEPAVFQLCADSHQVNMHLFTLFYFFSFI